MRLDEALKLLLSITVERVHIRNWSSSWESNLNLLETGLYQEEKYLYTLEIDPHLI